jgi:hypothetical protein
MDKGFNDDELADIMSEIESLEQEFASDDEVVKAQEPGLDEVAQSVAAMVAEEEEDVESEEVESEAVAEVEDTEEADEPEPMIAQQEEVEEAFEEEQAVMEQAPVIKHSDSSPESSSDDEFDEFDEVLEELTSMSVEDIVPQKNTESFDENIHHIKVENDHKNEESVMTHKNTPSKSAKTAMSFSVEGDMKLDLSFLIGGNEVQIHVTEAGLEIELEGGAKFTLPVHGPDGAKQAA